MRYTLREIAIAVAGNLRGASDVVVTGVSTDTRAIAPGDLFVAIRGDTFDGHAFLAQAALRGAAAAIVSREEVETALPTLVVRDTIAALGDLARAHRAQFTGPVVAITGSNGKTTTRELCATILRTAGARVCQTKGNLNNHIGLPLSVLSVRDDDDVLVVEMGMNHPGEIDALARIAQPSVGGITKVAPAHLGPMGSIDAIALAKGELLDRLAATGTAVLNADDPHVMAQRKRFAGAALLFGFGANADFRGVPDARDPRRFEIVTPLGSTSARMSLPGAHLQANGLCAAAAAFATGLLGDDAIAAIRRGLEDFGGVPGRLSLRETADGLRIIDDSYNANPDSLEASVKTLMTLTGERAGARAFVVLGDIGELGTRERDLHRACGHTIAQAGVHALLCVGDLAAEAAKGAEETGIAIAETLPDVTRAAARVRELAQPGDFVLVKGSHAAAMGRVAAALEESG